MTRAGRPLVRPRFLVAVLLGTCVLLVAPISLLLIAAKVIAQHPFLRTEVWVALSFLPALALSAVAIHFIERRRQPGATTILIAAAMIPPALVFANLLAVFERSRFSPGWTELPAAVPIVVLGAAIFGLLLVERSTKWRFLLATLALALAGFACVWIPRIRGQLSHSFLLAPDLNELAWKIPIFGALLLAATLLASMRRLRMVRLPVAVILSVPFAACFVFLRPYESPLRWQASEITSFSGARLAPNGDLYLFDAQLRARPTNQYAPRTIVRSRGKDFRRFVRVSRRPLPPDLTRSEPFSPDFRRITTSETLSPWAQLRGQLWLTKIYDAMSGSEEIVPSEDANLYLTGGTPPRPLLGPGRSWALVVYDGISGSLRSGKKFRVALESRIDRTWIAGATLHAYLPGRRLGEAGRRDPAILTFDLDRGDVRKDLVAQGFWLAAVSPSGENLVFGRAANAEIVEWYSRDRTGNLSPILTTASDDSPLFFWLADGSALGLSRRKFLSLLSPALAGRWDRPTWPSTAAMDARQIGSRLYAVATDRRYGRPIAIIEFDETLTRAKLIRDLPGRRHSSGLSDYQWLPDSILFSESNLYGDSVVRYWPADRRRQIVFSLDPRATRP